MRIDVVGRNLTVTPAIRQHAEQKADKLLKYYNGIQQIVWTFGKEDHQHTPAAFTVELRIDVQRHEDFVVHCKGPDLYAAIDEAVHKGTRQLTEHKAQVKPGPHRGA